MLTLQRLYLVIGILTYLVIGFIVEVSFIRDTQYCVIYCGNDTITTKSVWTDSNFWVNILPYWPLELFMVLTRATEGFMGLG